MANNASDEIIVNLVDKSIEDIQKDVDKVVQTQPIMMNLVAELGIANRSQLEMQAKKLLDTLYMEVIDALDNVALAGNNPLAELEVSSEIGFDKSTFERFENGLKAQAGNSFTNLKDYIQSTFAKIFASDDKADQEAAEALKKAFPIIDIFDKALKEYQTIFGRAYEKNTSMYSSFAEIFKGDKGTSGENPLKGILGNLTNTDIQSYLLPFLEDMKSNTTAATEETLQEVRQQIVKFFSNPNQAITLHFRADEDELTRLRDHVDEVFNSIKLQTPDILKDPNAGGEATAKGLDVSNVVETIQKVLDETPIYINNFKAPAKGFDAQVIKEFKGQITKAIDQHGGIEIDSFVYKKPTERQMSEAEKPLKQQAVNISRLREDYVKAVTSNENLTSIFLGKENLPKDMDEFKYSIEKSFNEVSTTIKNSPQLADALTDVLASVNRSGTIIARQEHLTVLIEQIEKLKNSATPIEKVTEALEALNIAIRKIPVDTDVKKTVDEATGLNKALNEEKKKQAKAPKKKKETQKEQQEREAKEVSAEQGEELDKKSENSKFKVHQVIAAKDLDINKLRKSVEDALNEQPVTLYNFRMYPQIDLSEMRRDISQDLATEPIQVSNISYVNEKEANARLQQLQSLKEAAEWFVKNPSQIKNNFLTSDLIDSGETQKHGQELWDFLQSLQKVRAEMLEIQNSSEGGNAIDIFNKMAQEYNRGINDVNQVLNRAVNVDALRTEIQNKLNSIPIEIGAVNVQNVDSLRSQLEETLSGTLNNLTIKIPDINVTYENVHTEVITEVLENLYSQTFGVKTLNNKFELMLASMAESLLNSLKEFRDMGDVKVPNLVFADDYTKTQERALEYAQTVQLASNVLTQISRFTQQTYAIQEALRNFDNDVNYGKVFQALDDYRWFVANHKEMPTGENIDSYIKQIESVTNMLRNVKGITDKQVDTFYTNVQKITTAIADTATTMADITPDIPNTDILQSFGLPTEEQFRLVEERITAIKQQIHNIVEAVGKDKGKKDTDNTGLVDSVTSQFQQIETNITEEAKKLDSNLKSILDLTPLTEQIDTLCGTLLKKVTSVKTALTSVGEDGIDLTNVNKSIDELSERFKSLVTKYQTAVKGISDSVDKDFQPTAAVNKFDGLNSAITTAQKSANNLKESIEAINNIDLDNIRTTLESISDSIKVFKGENGEVTSVSLPLINQLDYTSHRNIQEYAEALKDIPALLNKLANAKARFDKNGETITLPSVDITNITALDDNFESLVNNITNLADALEKLSTQLGAVKGLEGVIGKLNNQFAKGQVSTAPIPEPTQAAEQAAAVSKEEYDRMFAEFQNALNDELIRMKTGDIFKTDQSFYTDNAKNAVVEANRVLKENIQSILDSLKDSPHELETAKELYNEVAKTFEEMQATAQKSATEYETFKKQQETLNKLIDKSKNVKTQQEVVALVEKVKNFEANINDDKYSVKDTVDALTIINEEMKNVIEQLMQEKAAMDKASQDCNALLEKFNKDSIIKKATTAAQSATLDDTGKQKIQEILTEYNQLAENLKSSSITIEDATTQFTQIKQNLEAALAGNNNDLTNTKNLATLQNINTQIEKIFSTNTKLNRAVGIGKDFNDLSNSIDRITTAGQTSSKEVSNIRIQFEKLKKQMESTGMSGRSALDRLAATAKSAFRRVFAGDTTYRLISAIRNIPSIVKEIDSAMTDLKRVTSETSSAYNDFLKDATTNATKLGATISDVVSATSQFARLGYTMQESSTLAQNAILYSNVGWLDVKTATNDIVSAMKAFNITAEDSIKIVDTFNTLGNKFGLTSADVGQGLKVSASALATANNSFEETAAMLTAITEITQDPSSAGNALKTLSLRLRSTKAELEEMGEDTDGVVETTSKLRKQLKEIVGVDILKNKDEYKSTYEIMKGIASVWKDLTDTQQASILESLAGKTRANQVAALLNNWSQAEKALEESLSSSGSAVRENSTYLKSAEGRLKQLKATGQEFATNTFNSDAIKGFLKIATDLLEVLNKMTSIKLPFIGSSTLPAMLGISSAAMSIKNPESGAFSIVSNWMGRIQSALKNWNTPFDFKYIDEQMKGVPVPENLEANTDAMIDYRNALNSAVNSMGSYTQRQKDLIIGAYEQRAANQGATLSYGQLTVALIKDKIAAIGLRIAQTALNAVIGMGIGLVIQAGVAFVTHLVQANEKAAESALDSADALKEEIETIDDAKKKIQELTEELRSGNLTQAESYEKRKEIISIQDELVDKYGVEKTAVDELNNSLDTYIENMEKAKQEDYQEWLSMNGSAVKNAEKTLRNSGFFSAMWRIGGSDLFGNLIRGSDETYLVKEANDLKQNINVRKQREELLRKYTNEAGLWLRSNVFETSIRGFANNTEATVKAYKTFLDETAKDNAFANDEWLKTVRDRIAVAYKNLTEDEDYKSAVAILKENAQAIVETTPELKEAETEMSQAVADYQAAVIESDIQQMKSARSKILQIYEQHQTDFADEYIKAIFDAIANVVLEDVEGTKLTVEDEISKHGGTDLMQGFTKGKNRTDILKWYQLMQQGSLPLSYSSVDDTRVFDTLNAVLEATGLSIEDVVDSFVKLGWVEEDISKKVSKTTPFATIIKETEDATKALGNFDSAISKMSITNDNSVLTADELNTLIGYDATLVNEVERTADGYLIAADKLVEARQKYYKAQKENLQTEINDAQTELDEMQATLKKLEATPEDKRDVTYADDVKQTKENIKTLEQNISSYRLALLELQAPTTDFRTSLGDITSKAESLSSSLVTMQREEEKLGAISSDTAVEFIANNKNWEDFLELTDKGTFKLKASADGYEELIKQSSGYNDVMAKLKTQQSQQNDRFLELQSSLQSGKGDVKSLVDEITNCYEEMGNTEGQIKTLDDLFQKFFSHLEASEAVQKFTDKVSDLNHQLNMGEITAKQRTAEYEELIEGLRTAAANGDKDAQNELESAEETLYNYRITDMTEEADDAFDALNRSYDRGNKNLQAKLNNYKSIVEKYYAPGTLLGDTEDGQEKYLSYLDEVYSMQNQVYENDYSTHKKAIDRLYEDSEVTVDAIDDKIKAYTQLNEEFYNPDTGKLGKTREAIDSETYIENQREIQNLQHEAYEKHEAEAERIKNISGNTAEAVKTYWNSVMTYAKQYLADIPQYQDELQEIIDNYNSTGQKEMHDADLDALQRRNDLGLISDKEYWQSRYALAEQYYKNNEALVEDWQSEEQAYLTEGMQDMYNEETKLSQQAYDKGEINLGTHLENMIAAWKTYYKDKAELRDEDLQAQQDIYDETISAYNDQKSALEKQKELIEKPYNDEIDKLNESKEEFDRVVDNKINKLNEQKSALEKVNSQIQHQTDLIKAQNDLEKAKRNTRLIYTGSGWDTQRDEAAYQDALSNYEQAKNTSEADAMQQQIDALNDTKDKIDTWYNDEIQAHKDEMKLATKEVDCLIGLLDYVTGKMEMGRIDPSLIATVATSDYGKDYFDDYNKLEKYYDNTNRGVESQFSDLFGNFQKINGISKNMGISDSTLTEYASLFNYLGNLTGGKANAYTGITTDKTNGYFSSSDAKRAYIQLYGSKKYDPTTDTIDMKLSDGVFMTSDGAILVAEELAKSNKTTSEQLAAGYKKDWDKTTAETKNTADGLSTKDLLTMFTGISQVFSDSGTLDKLNQKVQENQKKQLDNAATKVTTPDTILTKPPTFNITIEGNTDENTVSQIRTELTSAFNEYTDLFTTKLYTYYQRQATTQAAT